MPVKPIGIEERPRSSDQSLGTEIPRVLDRLTKIENFFRQVVFLERDRRTNQLPIFTWSFGPWRFFRAATGEVAATGGSRKFLLTSTGQPGGKALFSEMPTIRIYVSPAFSASGNFVESVRKPVGPLRAWALDCAPSYVWNAEYEISWDADNQHWAATITNNGIASQEFVVQAEGVYYEQ